MAYPESRREKPWGFDPEHAAKLAQAREEARDLLDCGSCDSPFVQPTEWEEEGERHWKICLRCPNCEERGTVVIPDSVVDQYDLLLERGSAELARDLHELAQSNIEEEAERLRDALDQDLLLPEDF